MLNHSMIALLLTAKLLARQVPLLIPMVSHGAKTIIPDLYGVVHSQVNDRVATLLTCQVYRSNMPSREHYPFLQSLKLKTVVLLSPEKPLRDFQEFLRDQNIELVRLPRACLQPHSPPHYRCT